VTSSLRLQYSIAAIVAHFGTPDGMLAFAKGAHLCPDLVRVLEAPDATMQVTIADMFDAVSACIAL
jgi:hypothetical protein